MFYSVKGKSIIFFCIWIIKYLWAQPVIVKFISGNPTKGTFAYVALYNPKPYALNLKGYYVATRYYVLQLPSVVLRPKQRLILTNSKKRFGAKQFHFRQLKNFLIRFPMEGAQGDYVALFAPDGTFLQGFYFSPSRYVPFLPDSIPFFIDERRVKTLALPPETARRWAFLRANPDPAIGFAQIQGKWYIIAADPKRNILKLTRFEEVKLWRSQGWLHIVAQIESQIQEAAWVLVQRSSDGKNFYTIDTLFLPPRKKNLIHYHEPLIYKQPYYYRLVHIDYLGYKTYSQVLSWQQRKTKGLSVTWFPRFASKDQDLWITITTEEGRQVRLWLLKQTYDFIKLLYEGYLQPRSPILLQLKSGGLESGLYYLIVEEEGERYWYRLSIYP